MAAEKVKTLTKRQQAFVEHYLANGFNATKAAKDAGYSEKTAYSIGSENLRKPEIASHVRARMKALTMSADEALYRLSAMARGDLGGFGAERRGTQGAPAALPAAQGQDHAADHPRRRWRADHRGATKSKLTTPRRRSMSS